jgi:hypothetical protein
MFTLPFALEMIMEAGQSSFVLQSKGAFLLMRSVRSPPTELFDTLSIR